MIGQAMAMLNILVACLSRVKEGLGCYLHIISLPYFFSHALLFVLLCEVVL